MEKSHDSRLGHSTYNYGSLIKLTSLICFRFARKLHFTKHYRIRFKLNIYRELNICCSLWLRNLYPLSGLIDTFCIQQESKLSQKEVKEIWQKKKNRRGRIMRETTDLPMLTYILYCFSWGRATMTTTLTDIWWKSPHEMGYLLCISWNLFWKQKKNMFVRSLPICILNYSSS